MATVSPALKPDRRRPWAAGLGLLVVLVFMVAVVIHFVRRPPSIPFMSYGEDYASKPDFATLERSAPLTPEHLRKLTPSNITRFNQEQIEQVFARLTAGPFPQGDYDVHVTFPTGASGNPRIAEVMGGLHGVEAGLELRVLQLIMDVLWKDKRFDRDRGIVRTRVTAGVALTSFLEHFFPHRPDGRAALASQKTDAYMLFPAKVYCGQSLIDSRRESIVIDYNFADDIEGYRVVPDSLTGRGDCENYVDTGCVGGLFLHDEIRRVRPGFYLGRLYSNNVFLANFTLFSQKAEKEGENGEACWTGPQRAANQPR